MQPCLIVGALFRTANKHNPVCVSSRSEAQAEIDRRCNGVQAPSEGLAALIRPSIHTQEPLTALLAIPAIAIEIEIEIEIGEEKAIIKQEGRAEGRSSQRERERERERPKDSESASRT